MKEEGQSLIHAANTWGDKTMSSTSLEGRDIIQSELSTIQRDWDAFLSAISDTRMALESCLLQWSDFDDSSEQIQRWLKDMERRLKDSEPKADLSEKKAQHQRFKVSTIILLWTVLLLAYLYEMIRIHCTSHSVDILVHMA